ncbi:MAG: hypothetical protein ACK5MK_14705 [Dysgonomonas sp.]
MRQNLIIIFLLLSSIAHLKASPQAPDYLIVGKDTIPLSQLILEDYLHSVKQPTDSNSLFGFRFGNDFGFESSSTNCWRGYQAVYSLENDSLFLKYIIPCNSLRQLCADDINNSNEQMQKVFQDKVKNNKVFIDWLSSEFTIPKGKPIWWDGIFTTIYEKEELYSIRKGILVDKHIINNYQKVKDGISRKKQEMSKAVFNEIKKLNWKKLDNEFLCSDTYCLEIDSRGKVINVEKNNSGVELDKDDIYCQNVIKNQLKKLQFDIILYHGRPFNDRLCLEVFYDDTTNKLENWSEYNDYNY